MIVDDVYIAVLYNGLSILGPSSYARKEYTGALEIILHDPQLINY